MDTRSHYYLLLSIKTRLEEVQKELARSPFKLGVLLVAVKDDTQAIAVNSELEKCFNPQEYLRNIDKIFDRFK